MKVVYWWKLSSDESYLVMKVKIVEEVKGVMACDVSPVAMFYNKKVSRPFSKFAFSTYLIQKIEAWTSFTSSGSIGWGISNYQLLKLPIWPRSSLPAFWPDAPDNIERHGHCLNAMMVNGRVFEVWWCGVTFVAYKPTNKAWFSRILMQ